MEKSSIIIGITEKLLAGGVVNAAQEARWLVEETPSAEELCSRVERRIAGEPLQYILGNAQFRYLTLDVDERVLIPRPETELLVDHVLKKLPPNGKLLDLGCGSGAIALSAAYERKDITVTAVDLSMDALTLAKKNAEKNDLTSRVNFVYSDLFSAVEIQKFDVIAANLPYVTEEEYWLLDSEVRNYEPKMALVAPDAGLEIILRAIEQLPEYLSDCGAVIFELSPPQAETVRTALIRQNFRSEIIYDLCNRARFVAGERNNVCVKA